MRSNIYRDIEAELEYAHQKWGESFDSRNTLNDWAAYITIYLAKAITMKASKEETRRALVKVAGLVVSALIWLERGLPARHYDGTEVTDEKGTRK